MVEWIIAEAPGSTGGRFMAGDAGGRIQVTAAVVARGGRVLLAQRPTAGRHADAWEFPGGKVEPGESPEECLAREMAEEMGVRVSVGRRLASITHEYPDLAIELIAFECELVGGEPRDVGCQAHTWALPDEVSTYGLLPPDRALAGIIFEGTEVPEMSKENSFLVRRFDPAKDVDAAYRCYVSGFYINSWPIIDHAEPRLIKDFILSCERAADATFVAEADGEARGILIGYFPAVPSSLFRMVRMIVAFELRVLFRRYRMTPFARAAWWRMAWGDVSYLVRQGRQPAEVLLLASQKEYRGGIGRAMMDAWVEETKARGYDRTVVNTDSTISWDFYERYGFKRKCAFPLKSFFYSLPGVDAEGYIYVLDIPGD